MSFLLDHGPPEAHSGEVSFRSRHEGLMACWALFKILALVALAGGGLYAGIHAGRHIDKAAQEERELARATVPKKVGYVVGLNNDRKPVFCWPVRDRDIDNDIFVTPDGSVCFNGDDSSPCSGSGALLVTPPLLALEPSPKEQGDAWLRGLGISACPGGRI